MKKTPSMTLTPKAKARVAERYVDHVIQEVKGAVEYGLVDQQTTMLIQALERIGRAASVCANNSGLSTDALEVAQQTSDGFARSIEYCKQAITEKRKNKETQLILQRLTQMATEAMALIEWLQEAPEAAWLHEKDTRSPEAIISAQNGIVAGLVADVSKQFYKNLNQLGKVQRSCEQR
jgi:hypothetical protein